MKLVPADACCASCGSRLHIHQCYDCERWFCWPCERDDFCTACKQRERDEEAAGVKRLPKSHYS